MWSSLFAKKDKVIDDNLQIKRNDKNEHWQEELKEKNVQKIIENKYIHIINNDNFNEFKKCLGEKKKCEFVSIQDITVDQTILSDEHCKKFSDIYFRNVDFKNCVFKNVRFDRCKFVNCTFDECRTDSGKVIFDHCSMWAIRNIKYDRSNLGTPVCTEFKNCDFRIDLLSCQADNLIFDNCKLLLSQFKDSDLTNNIFNKCSFDDVYFINCILKEIDIKDAKKMQFAFNNTKSELNYYSTIYVNKNSINCTTDSVDEYCKKHNKNIKHEKLCMHTENAIALKSIVDILYFNEFQSKLRDEYNYLYKKSIMHTKKDFFEVILYKINYIFFGFGEKMGRLIAWIIAYILGFSTLYMFYGIKLSDEQIINYTICGGSKVDFNVWFSDFIQCAYFSIITASTVGYGNIVPLGSASMFISVIQIAIGIIFTAFFTAMLIKKLLK